jgi:signal transduction histidine kinase
MLESGALTERRLRTLIEAGIAVSSELSLDGVLQKIVDAAAELTGARYAALGVIDRSGNQLERFLTTGMDPATHAAIGDLPRGRGILGVLIGDASPLRLHDLNQDARSVGFPPNHPPMRSFLGVPILLRGVAYGNLYQTEKEGGEDFTEEDEELTLLLAAQAAVSIENARLYESATRWLRQLESLNEVADALVSEMDLPRLLNLIAGRLRDLLDARLVTIMLPDSEEAVRIAAVDGEGAEDLGGLLLPLTGSKAGAVLRRRRSERVDSVMEDLEVDQEAARRMGARTGLYVPLMVRDKAIGVIGAHDKLGPDPRFSDDDLRLAETFGARAAVAVDLSQRVASDALRRVVEAQELERRRLARELHDETGQALTSILLGLRSVEEAAGSEEAAQAAGSLRELVVATLQDVRRLAIELRPKALDDFGLVPALERLVQTYEGDTGISMDLEAQLGDKRLPPEIETMLYRTVQESVTNIVKHAQAQNASILLTRRGGGVAAVIEDDGRGFDPTDAVDGVGLLGMRERLALLGGRLQIESSPGAGTTLVIEVPVR